MRMEALILYTALGSSQILRYKHCSLLAMFRSRFISEVCQRFYSHLLYEREGISPPNISSPAVVVSVNGVDNSSYAVSSGGNGTAGNNTNGLTTPAPKAEEPEEHFHPLVDFLWAVTVAIFVLFGMVGAFISGKVADYFGRKKGMIVITVLMFIAAVFGGIPIIVNSFEVLIVHRAFVGLHCGINVSLASLYLAEISPKKIRGAVGTIHQLFITIGILWSNIMGVSKLAGRDGVWPWVYVFNAFPAFICLVCMPFCPESPRWLLIKKGEEQEARDALRKFRGYLDVEDEIDEMKIEARKSQSIQQFSLKQLLTTPELKIPLFIAIMMQVSQQWSGINAVMSYSSFMYKNAGVDKNLVEWVVCLTSTINVLTTIVAVPLMEKLGRRPLLIWPMVGMLLSFVLLTIFHNLQYVEDLKDHHSVFAYISIVVMHTYVIGFAIGLGPIPFIVVSEIFRQEPRAAAMSFSLTFNWICNFVLMLVFRFMQKSMLGYVYLPFIVTLALAITFIFFMVPETKNRTFDDIANSIAFGKKRGKKSKAFGDQDGEELQQMT
ncbi:hypothetical protein KUTeg_002693 [Tegillarca granosa]|uniref:Major facilitator superfamily (MFS) profile domain-containing protein n=1 Tax=Tegillarca granosa TaxID=220873 RepID=A0ABQ9FWJ4_TEGGR|nr:hypothetical protein KUTeg_002693 [Tegillarca granosa]